MLMMVTEFYEKSITNGGDDDLTLAHRLVKLLLAKVFGGRLVDRIDADDVVGWKTHIVVSAVDPTLDEKGAFVHGFDDSDQCLSKVKNVLT